MRRVCRVSLPRGKGNHFLNWVHLVRNDYERGPYAAVQPVSPNSAAARLPSVILSSSLAADFFLAGLVESPVRFHRQLKDQKRRKVMGFSRPLKRG